MNDYSFGLLAWWTISGSQATSIMTIWQTALEWHIEGGMCYMMKLTREKSSEKFKNTKGTLSSSQFIVFSTTNVKEILTRSKTYIYIYIYMLYIVADFNNISFEIVIIILLSYLLDTVLDLSLYYTSIISDDNIHPQSWFWILLNICIYIHTHTHAPTFLL